jgi:hypothetical protein
MSVSEALKVSPHDTLWVTDAELIRRSGVPERVMRENLRMWDRNPRFGFPPKLKVYGNRRYWPAVEAYFARASQVKIPVIPGRSRNDD